jgi:heme oxygenase
VSAHAATTARSTAAENRFSARIRLATTASHRDAESAGLMASLQGGDPDRRLYVHYLAQLHVVYHALESDLDEVADDPIVGPFLRPELFRSDALAADLTYLVGADWTERFVVTPATAAYADRLRTVRAAWPAGFLAHHYTRYLGDLSGGLIIGRAVAAWLATPGAAGHSFFVFADIGDPSAFKAWYRDRLDLAAGKWDDAEQRRIIDEVRSAYQHNNDVMADVVRAAAA